MRKGRHEKPEPLELPWEGNQTYQIIDHPPMEVIDTRTEAEKIRDKTIAVLTAIVLTFIVLAVLAVIGTGLANWLWF